MQGQLLLAFPLFFIGLSRRREQHRVQKLTSCRGLNLPVFEQMGFQTHHDWVLGEEEECTESYFPCLFPASSDTSSTFMFEEAKSAMQETHRRNSSSTVLRFEQKLSPGDDERFGILYSSSSSGDGFADIARQELGRPFLVRTHRRMLQIGNSQSQGEILSISLQEGGEQASKRHCSNVRKQGKAKSCASKDPQSVAAKNRRERISERLKILQELVPNGTKVDLVTMLEKAISYVKFLQLQVKVLATDEFWPVQGGKAPEVSQVKAAMDAILSSNRVGNCSFQS